MFTRRPPADSPPDCAPLLSIVLTFHDDLHPDNLEIPYRFADRCAGVLGVGGADPQDSLRQ
jgi:hypothetical protein